MALLEDSSRIRWVGDGKTSFLLLIGIMKSNYNPIGPLSAKAPFSSWPLFSFVSGCLHSYPLNILKSKDSHPNFAASILLELFSSP